MNLDKKKRDRFKFLKTVYKESKGEEGYIFNMWEIGNSLGFSREETSSIFNYLEGEGLLVPMALGGGFSITHFGILEIEESLSEPNKSTEHFLPFNQYNITIGNMSGGAVQQGNINSNINILSNETISNIENYVSSFKKFLAEEISNNELRDELLADIETLSQQSKSPKPKSSIMKVTLNSIKDTLVGAIGGVIGTLATPKAQEFLHLTEQILNSCP